MGRYGVHIIWAALRLQVPGAAVGAAAAGAPQGLQPPPRLQGACCGARSSRS